MVKTELIKRSPLRILEKSIQGGLGKGNIGILASKKGVGKTACLVHIATDKLFQGTPIIHVSFASRVDYIINWYADIFNEIARKRKLESALEVHDELIKNRVIMNFHQDASQTDQVLKSLEAMIKYGNFRAETIIVDSYDFARTSPEDLHKFKKFAQQLELEVWFSASLKGDDPLFDDKGMPLLLKEFMSDIAVLITLGFKQGHIQLNLVKDHDSSPQRILHLILDPKTLLIAEKE